MGAQSVFEHAVRAITYVLTLSKHGSGYTHTHTLTRTSGALAQISLTDKHHKHAHTHTHHATIHCFRIRLILCGGGGHGGVDPAYLSVIGHIIYVLQDELLLSCSSPLPGPGRTALTRWVSNSETLSSRLQLSVHDLTKFVDKSPGLLAESFMENQCENLLDRTHT